MIRRYYAYNATTYIDAADLKFDCGIVSVKSWFPRPIQAFRDAMDSITSDRGCANKTRMEYFARV